MDDFPPELPDPRDEPWWCRIEKVGRWRYYLTYHQGIMVLSPGQFVNGRDRAERKAKRKLAELTAEDRRRREAWTVHPDA